MRQQDIPLMRLAFVGLVALFAYAAIVPGCNANPRVDFASAQDTYVAVVQTLVLNRDKFSEETWEEDILPLINAGDAALDQYDVLTAADLPAESAIATLRQVLVALSAFIEQME